MPDTTDVVQPSVRAMSAARLDLAASPGPGTDIAAAAALPPASTDSGSVLREADDGPVVNRADVSEATDADSPTGRLLTLLQEAVRVGTGGALPPAWRADAAFAQALWRHLSEAPGPAAWTAEELAQLLLQQLGLQARGSDGGPSAPDAGASAGEWFVGAPSTDDDDDLQRHFEALTDPLVGGGLAVSAGVLLWATRAGGLLAALMASLPAWRSFDPIPIVARQRDDRDGCDDAFADDDGVSTGADSGTAAGPTTLPPPTPAETASRRQWAELLDEGAAR